MKKLDKIVEVAKGVNLKDLLPHIMDRQEREFSMGFTLSLKMHEIFSASWVSKLKEDVKRKNASYGVLVTDFMGLIICNC